MEEQLPPVAVQTAYVVPSSNHCMGFDKLYTKRCYVYSVLQLLHCS
jgi:hypothetical protein